MSAQVLQLSDHEILVFGLSWRVLDSMEPRGQQVNKLRDQGAKFSVSFKNEHSEENLGISTDVDLGPASNKTRLISGAAQIARHKDCVTREAVLITIEEPGSEGHAAVVAVVGVLRGNIILDEMVTPDEVQSKREWFFGEANNRQIRSNDVGGVSHSIPEVDFAFTWSDVLSTRSPGMPLLPKVPYTLSVLAPQINPKILKVGAALCGVMVLGGAGLQGYVYWKATEAKKKAALARKAPDPLVVYQQSVQALLAATMWPAKSAFPQLIDEISRQVPVFRRGGWALDAVKCEVESALCAYSWHREKGTMATFRDALGDQKWDSIQYGVAAITASKKVSLIGSQLPERSAWLAMDRYEINERSVWTHWQDLGVKFTYGDPSVAGLPNGITEGQVTTSPVLTRAVQWKVEGSPWSHSVIAGLPNASSLQSLSMRFKSELGGLPSLDITAAGQIFLR